MSQNGLPQIISNVPQVFYEIMAYYTASISMLVAVTLLFVNKDSVSGLICGNDVELWFILIIAVLPLYAYGQIITLLAWLLVDVWIVTPFVMGLERQKLNVANQTDQKSDQKSEGLGQEKQSSEKRDQTDKKTDQESKKRMPFPARAKLFGSRLASWFKRSWLASWFVHSEKSERWWWPIPVVFRAIGWLFGHFVHSHARNKAFLWSDRTELVKCCPKLKDKPWPCDSSKLMYDIRLVNPGLVDTLIKEYARCDLAKASALNAFLLAILVPFLHNHLKASVCGPWMPWGLWWLWCVVFLLVSLLFSIEYYFRRSRTNTHVLEAYQAVMNNTTDASEG